MPSPPARLFWGGGLFFISGPAVIAAATTTSQATAADFPDRPLRLVVPFPPGAGTDATARIVAQKLGELLHQTVVVDNVAGANGPIGMNPPPQTAPHGSTPGGAAP